MPCFRLTFKRAESSWLHLFPIRKFRRRRMGHPPANRKSSTGNRSRRGLARNRVRLRRSLFSWLSLRQRLRLMPYSAGLIGLRAAVCTMSLRSLSINYALACALYCVVAIVGCVVLALPGVLFALAAGAVFGPVVGTVLCWASMTLGACGAFCVGRYFLKDALKPRLEKSQLLNRLLFEGADRSDVFVLAVTRLVPVFPFNFLSYHKRSSLC